MGEDTEKIITIMQNPRQYKIPDWFLNRNRDHKDGKTAQVMANILDNKLREDLERLKDQGSPWSSSLLGPACARSAYQDYRSQGKDRRCVQEEVSHHLQTIARANRVVFPSGSAYIRTIVDLQIYQHFS